MKRIYPAFAYSDAPRQNCWWDETCTTPERPALKGDQRCDVAIIGAGFTGISAALYLAQQGVTVRVLDSHFVGWGASGRNGGFCCLGGGRLEDDALDHAFGIDARLEWRRTEVAAIRLVEDLIDTHGLEVDRHSNGETLLAHRPKDFAAIEEEAARTRENYGVDLQLIAPEDLESHGMNAGYHGAATIPIGFGLNPRKYITGLAMAAENVGAVIHDYSPVRGIERSGGQYQLRTQGGAITADKVIVATNGYSSEDLPDWFAARYMPTQSSIIVTRPMTQSELAAQGWTTAQAAYDTKHLLHYFRLMPDNRMLFGVRGGLMANAGSEARAIARARRDFDRMFPAWTDVETTNAWSGMVCIARKGMPFVGEVPDQPGMFAALCYHGNGVAMASYSGAVLADLVSGTASARVHARAAQRPLARFELGRFRRAVMPFAYAGFALADR